MRFLDDLPEDLRRGPFRVATARQHGVEASRLQDDDLRRDVWGVRDASEAAPTYQRLCRIYAARFTGVYAFSDETAATHWRLPLPARLQDPDEVHITVPKGRRAPHAKGLVGHQRVTAEGDTLAWRGLVLTTPARTLCDLASRLSLHEAVAVADFIVAGRRPLATIEELREQTARYEGRRGRVVLRDALSCADGRSESPKESELRVVLVTAGFPAPTCNLEVRDHAFSARIDLAYPDLKIAVEYEGDHHRDKTQWRKDLQRRRRLEALGWIYLSVTQADLDDPTDLFADLRAAFAARTAH